jgi:hypothetical protein
VYPTYPPSWSCHCSPSRYRASFQLLLAWHNHWWVSPSGWRRALDLMSHGRLKVWPATVRNLTNYTHVSQSQSEWAVTIIIILLFLFALAWKNYSPRSITPPRFYERFCVPLRLGANWGYRPSDSVFDQGGGVHSQATHVSHLDGVSCLPLA